MKKYFKHVEGKNKGKVILYAISTCIWCKKTKRLFNELGIEYYYVDVDTMPEDEKPEIRKEVIHWKQKASYPCIIINNKCIPTYNEEEIKKELGVI